MKKNAGLLAVLASSALLLGCADPRQQCISAATQEYRSAASAANTARQNISRGYAVFSQQVPYTVHQTCYRSDPVTFASIPYPCPQTYYRTQSTPVAIDVAQERTKLAQINRLLPRLAAKADAEIRRCETQFPVTS
tara:strand:+ start:438 stop:845 length:408 start_codon:yes stop_codon:yes gene_type:complete